VGYLAVACDGDGGLVTLGPVLVTADEFGPNGPSLDLGAQPVGLQVEAMDAAYDLQTGDVILLGAANLPSERWRALWNEAAGPSTMMDGPCHLWPPAQPPPVGVFTPSAFNHKWRG
jgi:hypothetical protein